jgi:Methyltransferase domain
MAFIDGLHHFEQVLRDFINVEKRATSEGLIVIHDCIPFDEVN